MEYNRCQSKIPDDLNQEVLDEIKEAVNGIGFLKNLISSKRKELEDCEFDEKGKVIVDIVNPHILKDMDYFRQAAIHFEKHECYTTLRPNGHPHSEYTKFWKEEARRCREGLVRPDGEWITGYHYFYLNYSPIMKTKDPDSIEETSDRIEGFPNFWDGDYLYFHYIDQARKHNSHGNVLKARGRGFSFKGGSKKAKNFILGSGTRNKSKVKAFAIANEKEFLTKDGVLNKFEDVINHCADHTPFPRLRLKESWQTMEFEMGYTDSDGRKRGTRNIVQGVSLKNDAQKARGKRGALIIWEEMGKFPNILTAWQVARPSVEDGNRTFGTMVAYGTGGTEGADFSGAREMFYNPSGYNIYALPNIFDKNRDGLSKCAFFFPEYLNRHNCYDENGNSDVTKALIEIMQERIKIKYNTSDPNALSQEKAERPITPQEAIMRKDGNFFPVTLINDHLADIEPRAERFFSAHYVGRIANGEFVSETGIRPIRKFPLENKEDKQGAIEIITMPQKKDGKVPFGRYIAGLDPYDDDHSTTTSLGSIIILDTYTDKIVAEYTGRPATANEFYQICYDLIKFYNALVNYENNKKGFYAFMHHRAAIHHLCETPQILKDTDMVKGQRYGNQAVGTPATQQVNAWARRLQVDWMLEPVITIQINEKGEEEEVVKNKLHYIRNKAYLEECSKYNPDGNFDRISAMGMLMILRQDRLKQINKPYEEQQDILANDPFFMKRFNKNKGEILYENYLNKYS